MDKWNKRVSFGGDGFEILYIPFRNLEIKSTIIGVNKDLIRTDEGRHTNQK